MSNPAEELLEIADQLGSVIKPDAKSNVFGALDALEEAAQKIGTAWSGSWLGYHANVYYADFKNPPPGAHFSSEWGMEDTFSGGTTGDWREYDSNFVDSKIRSLAGSPDLKSAHKLAQEMSEKFDQFQSDIMSILTTATTEQSDSFLKRVEDDIGKIKIHSRAALLRKISPSGQLVSRDSIAVHQGIWTPPHFDILSETLSIRAPFNACDKLAKLAKTAGSHLSRQAKKKKKAEIIGTNVFIGHGQSLVWRELKDFIEDRLKLPVDEFNRVPVAGVTNIARLSEMLDAAAFAFLIMTGEDEQPDGALRARMNVVHEAGLFQGRLGFMKAIVLLEEGCDPFSNIDGLGQIRFPKGKIDSAFEQIRQVLEREGLVELN